MVEFTNLCQWYVLVDSESGRCACIRATSGEAALLVYQKEVNKNIDHVTWTHTYDVIDTGDD